MDPTAFAAAYALSSSVGLRPFLTLALASLAMHVGLIHPSHAFLALGSNGTTILLALIAVVEFFADKIPVVDHALHALHFAVKPAVAAILVGSVVPDIGPGDAVTYALMGTGALNALGIHGGVAGLRGVSTVTTGGLGNPVVSFIEDVIAAGGTILAILLPFAAAAFALVLTIVLILLVRGVYRRTRGRAAVTS